MASFAPCNPLCGTGAHAEELVHETLTRALRRPGRVRRRDDPVHLMRVPRRAWHDLQQPRAAGSARGRRPHAIEGVVDGGGDPDLRAGHMAGLRATSDLPPPRREAITAVDVLGLSNRDAANVVAECADFGAATRAGATGGAGLRGPRTQACRTRPRAGRMTGPHKQIGRPATRCLAVGGWGKHP
jgi:hypothetical protein